MKKFAQKKCRKMFLEAIFFAFDFFSFRTKFLSLLYMISLAYKISHCLSANHYPELRCVICTGVTLFALVLHLNCTALSQSESSNFFMCIINELIYPILNLYLKLILVINSQSQHMLKVYSWREMLHNSVQITGILFVCLLSCLFEQQFEFLSNFFLLFTCVFHFLFVFGHKPPANYT